MKAPREIQPVLNALFVFEQAAKAGSFTAAAQQLGMAQPSVSRFVANLEDHLGTPLFDRKHNKVRLTPVGEELKQATGLGFGHIRTVMAQIAAARGRPVVTITCTHGFAHMWVAPRLEALKALLPDCELQTTAVDEALASTGVPNDLEIRFGDGNWEGVTALHLFDEEVFPVCTPGFLQSHGFEPDKVTALDLGHLPLLRQAQGHNEWASWSDWFLAQGGPVPDLSQAQAIPNYHFILQSAMEGKGIALAWAHLEEPFLSNGWLLELPGMRLKTVSGYYLTHRPDHPYADQIKDWISQTR